MSIWGTTLLWNRMTLNPQFPKFMDKSKFQQVFFNLLNSFVMCMNLSCRNLNRHIFKIHAYDENLLFDNIENYDMKFSYSNSEENINALIVSLMLKLNWQFIFFSLSWFDQTVLFKNMFEAILTEKMSSHLTSCDLYRAVFSCLLNYHLKCYLRHLINIVVSDYSYPPKTNFNGWNLMTFGPYKDACSLLAGILDSSKGQAFLYNCGECSIYFFQRIFDTLNLNGKA